MKLFVKHILKVILGLILCAYALDFMYSQVYLNSKFRNKIQLALQDAPEEYDLIFLGSSRANNHFVTALFEKKGLKAFNFGMSGASLEESALLLELLITKQSHLKNVVLEVDLNLRSEFFSNGTRALFMPYLKNNLVISDYYKHTMVHYNRYLYIPFYRYITYETKIGFREMIFSLFHKKSKLFDNKGYEPLFGSQKGMAYDLRGVKPSRNKNFEKIRSICKAKRINLIEVI
ncbi:hypothetical protein [Flavobacterium psychrophilum]|uniref:hypothetical protein n=1 Tax=Flavobacterium psychrophilum TaxID=96345 RepID=UPI00106B16D6|nr:hypothetical protein [Flavobacterium psychrophilum]